MSALRTCSPGTRSPGSRISQLLGKLFEILGRDAGGPLAIFYWGCNDRQDFPLDLRAMLKKRFKERCQRLSEPDIIIVGRHDVVFVEAKFGSPNECRTDDARVDKYVQAIPDCSPTSRPCERRGTTSSRGAGAIGSAVAHELGRAFTLVNLVRSGDEAEVLKCFGSRAAPATPRRPGRVEPDGTPADSSAPPWV